jgi:predicted chitinase
VGFRTVYGNTHSENGWPMVDTGSCTWVRIPDAPHVSLQIQNGDPLICLRAFANDFHVNVEPLRDADSACWTATNSVGSSNHLSGTGMDLNWNGADGRTFRLGIPIERAYPGHKAQALRDLLEFWEGMIFCGGYWSIRDWMHFQMGGRTFNNPRTQDFIRRKIRADGRSTYRRDSAPPPPPPPPPAIDAAAILARATDIPLAKAQAILPQVQFALTKANCTNPRRIAAALAQWVIESGHFKYTEEIADGPESQERWKYKGRTWVQLTWLENYRGFSQWVHSLGLVPTPDYFVQRPKELAEQKWAALGPAYWWAIKYPRINEYADRGDIDNVSKWVNAPAWVDKPDKHANHEKERRDAYHKALALGDQLLALTSTAPQGEGFLMALSDQQQRELYDAICGHRPSMSPLRPLGSGNIGNMRDVVGYADGTINWTAVKEAAELGHPRYLTQLRGVAAGDPQQFPDRADDIKLAQAILAEIEAPQAQPQARTVATPSAESSFAASEAIKLREENMKLRLQLAELRNAPKPEPEIVYLPAPAQELEQEPEPAPQSVERAPAVIDPNASTGQIIGQAYDALQALRLADALPIEDRAPLSALIAVLQTKNGADLGGQK